MLRCASRFWGPTQSPCCREHMSIRSTSLDLFQRADSTLSWQLGTIGRWTEPESLGPAPTSSRADFELCLQTQTPGNQIPSPEIFQPAKLLKRAPATDATKPYLEHSRPPRLQPASPTTLLDLCNSNLPIGSIVVPFWDYLIGS